MTWSAMSWHLSDCPSCSGDLYQEALDDDAFTCLQCGRVFDLAQSLSVAASAPAPVRPDLGKALLGDLWDQSLTPEARAALWSRLVVDVMVERDQTAEAARFKQRHSASRRSKAA